VAGERQKTALDRLPAKRNEESAAKQVALSAKYVTR
jgi:hypothetical protein